MERKPHVPEKLVDYLLSRLKRHILWDFLLFFSPPFFAVAYLAVMYDPFVSMIQEILIFAGIAILGVALLGLILRHRLTRTSTAAAARLIDKRVEGKDRFITLSTIEPSMHPPLFITRLRYEAAGLLHRMDLQKDFPYRVKRSFFVSLIGSLVVILLFYVVSPLSFLLTPRGQVVTEIVHRLARIPSITKLARNLEVLTGQIKKDIVSSLEKNPTVQKLMERLESQTAGDRRQEGAGNNNRDQTVKTRQGSKPGQEEGQERGSGGLKTNLPDERQGKGKSSGKGDGEKGKGELSALESKAVQGGDSARGEKQKKDRAGGGKAEGAGDRLKGGRKRQREQEGLAKGETAGKRGRPKGEQIPRGAVPDRFRQPGENGKKGIKGARFVTVQLPEEQTEGSGGKEGSGRGERLQPKIPVSNVPLRRPGSPGASPEKQPLPLEYRGLIR
ncbi:MAG: hypothetical protein ACE5HC_05880 [Candidatus Binatia bacterium]